jgi:hypothetical protein
LNPAASKYKNDWECAKDCVRIHGWRLGLFRGWWVTFWRDVPAAGFQFLSYEWTKKLLHDWEIESGRASTARLVQDGFVSPGLTIDHMQGSKESTTTLLVAGGVSGIFAVRVFLSTRSLYFRLPAPFPLHSLCSQCT